MDQIREVNVSGDNSTMSKFTIWTLHLILLLFSSYLDGLDRLLCSHSELVLKFIIFLSCCRRIREMLNTVSVLGAEYSMIFMSAMDANIPSLVPVLGWPALGAISLSQEEAVERFQSEYWYLASPQLLRCSSSNPLRSYPLFISIRFPTLLHSFGTRWNMDMVIMWTSEVKLWRGLPRRDRRKPSYKFITVLSVPFVRVF